MKKIKRRLAAIMFTDMVGYSALMQKDEATAGKLRDRHREVFVRNTEAYGGEILQYYGDGTLSIYPSASAAIECAIEIQRELRREPALNLRIGIHTGDISYGKEDVFGDGVNVAARIEKLCVPGGIFISDKVYDYIKNLNNIQTRSIGPFKLKNITKEVEIFAVTNEGVMAPPPGYYYKINPFGKAPAAPPKPATPATPARTTPVAQPDRAQTFRRDNVRKTGRKRKFAAGLLAFFFGVFGAHRFYLGQRELGLIYLGATLTGMFILKGLDFLIPIVAIIGFVDALLLFTMPRQDFDAKYNPDVQHEKTVERVEKNKETVTRPAEQPKPSVNPVDLEFEKLWTKARAEYQEYDYAEAIAILKQALEVKPDHPEAHFLLACCYSINENTDKTLYHLDAAVAFGLTDIDRIRTHRDLAYLRMQPVFESFVNNGFRLIKELPEPVEDLLLSEETVSPDLLEQLHELRKMRDEGQLTEIEYMLLMKKLNK